MTGGGDEKTPADHTGLGYVFMVMVGHSRAVLRASNRHAA